MNTRKILQFSVVITLALVALLVGMATSARASNPSQGGIPWLTTTPWPTARPLRVGEHFSLVVPPIVATSAPPSAPRNIPAPLPPVVAPLVVVSPVPSVVSQPNRAPALVPSVPTVAAPPPNPAPIIVPTPVPPPVVVAAPAPAPVSNAGGDSPTNPMEPSDTWRTLAAGASVWYKIGSGGVHMDVFLEANPLNGLSFDVFAAGNLQQPIGRGTLQNSTGRLVWAGGHWSSGGDWFARVTNGNPMSVQYKLTSTVFHKFSDGYQTARGNPA